MTILPTFTLMLLVATSVGMSALAQTLLKMGAVSAAPAAGAANALWAYATSPHILAGFALYGLGAVVWIFVLARLPLSVAYPFVGLGFIATMLLGGLVLGESLSAMRIAGTLMVAAGCVMVAMSAGEFA